MSVWGPSEPPPYMAEAFAFPLFALLMVLVGFVFLGVPAGVLHSWSCDTRAHRACVRAPIDEYQACYVKIYNPCAPRWLRMKEAP